MTSIGTAVGDFVISSIDSATSNSQIVRLSDFRGRWLLLLFYPRDFSFVCPTELTSFNGHITEFLQRKCEILACSIDSIETHRKWLSTAPMEGGIGPLDFPLASDPGGDLAKAFGIWIESKQLPARGVFIIDPDGVLQYSACHNLSVGRNVNEILRVLDALQSGGLCPAGWTNSQGIIDPDALLKPGRVLGHYRIDAALGKGSFGRVFSVYDLRLDRRVALKILSRSISESRSSLLAEARASAKLMHPNVCTIYAVDEEDGLPFIAMEMIEGQPLSELSSSDLAPTQKRKIAVGVANGLASAHALGIVHGDLKPANIMIDRNGRPRILDFGLSRCSQNPPLDQTMTAATERTEHLDPDDTTVYPVADSGQLPTATGQITGTPAYLSPEQSLGSFATTSSDVFSFGLLYFELLTGRKANEESSVVKTLQRVRSPEFADSICARSPMEHRDLLRTMLALAPDERPAIRQVLDRIPEVDEWS